MSSPTRSAFKSFFTPVKDKRSYTFKNYSPGSPHVNIQCLPSSQHNADSPKSNASNAGSPSEGSIKADDFEPERAESNPQILQSMLDAERAYATHLNQELESMKLRLETATTMLAESKKLVQEHERTLQSWQSQVRRKQTTIDSLKTELRILKPLVEVGVATRKLFLEQVRRIMEPAQRLENVEDFGSTGIFYINQCLVDEGNNAIHNANGDADIALFEGGFLSRECILARTFKELYQQPSIECRNCWPKCIRQAIDLSMTAQLFGMSSQIWDDEKQDEHYKITIQLIKDWDNQKEKINFANFDADVENQDKLAELKELTGRITSPRSLQPAARFFDTQINKQGDSNLGADVPSDGSIPDSSKYMFRQSNVPPTGFRLFPFTFQGEVQISSGGKWPKPKKVGSKGLELDVTPFIAGSDRSSRDSKTSDSRRMKGGKN